MIHRTINIPKKKSFFLFGARGTGKTSLLRKLFSSDDALFIDLLNVKVAEDFLAYPERFQATLDQQIGKYPWVVIDEIQKIPKLLDYVHQYISHKKFLFALTGSSARKLKRGASNLLAGRANVFNLYPLTWAEMGDRFDLDLVLSFGSLPDSILEADHLERKRYLEAYTHTYLKVEIISEQIVRNFPPFLRFLDVAAQSNSDIINYSNIAKDIGSDPKTVSNYFDILEDTLLGFRLPSYHTSIRKQQKRSQKFYFFDTGVVRSILGQTDYFVTPKSFEYGMLFESFLINEVYRILKYSERNFKLSFLRVGESQEIDLIIERNQSPTLLCEIKATEKVHDGYVTSLANLYGSIPNSKPILISRDKTAQIFQGIECLHWQEFIKQYL